MYDNFNNPYNGNENNYSQKENYPNYNNQNYGYDQNSEINEMYEKPNEKGKGFAIASMVLGIIAVCTFCCCLTNLPCSLIGIILGIISIASKRPGKGMAVTGIVLCSLAISIYIILIIYSVCSGTYQEIYDEIYDGFMEGFSKGYNSGSFIF